MEGETGDYRNVRDVATACYVKKDKFWKFVYSMSIINAINKL